MSSLSRAVLVLLVSGLTSSAFAQQASFDTQIFRPTPHGDGFFSVESGAIMPSLDVRAGLFVDYANQPLELISGGKRTLGLVDHRVDTDLLGAVTLGSRLSLGIMVPISVYQAGESVHADGSVGRFHSAVFGDLFLSPKVGLLDAKHFGIDLALALGVTLPTGNKTAFDGDRTVTLSPELDLSRHFGALRLAANFGYTWRQPSILGDLTVGQELFYRIGAGLDLRHFNPNVHIEPIAELYGRMSAPHPFAEIAQTPLEWALGARWTTLEDRVLVSLGGGRGITAGYGASAFRIFGAVTFVFAKPHAPPEAAPVVLDRDGDGIPDSLDKCPDQPEDKDGFEDEDGCPDPDNDHDGILDAADKCPNVAGPIENDGCPDQDSDGDGIVDRLDKCPTLAGPKENGGCPDKDTDGDGIVDRLDKCPNEPETINGVDDEDGCPDEGKTLVVMSKDSIQILQNVNFATGKDKILPSSFNLLNQVANTIRNHMEIKKIRVEGHTDNVGKSAANLKLSQRRADSVLRYLLGRGLDASRLQAVGYGDSRPLASNQTAKGRESNRRVAFTVVNEDAP